MPLKSTGSLLQEARVRLRAAGCEQAGLDARLLLQAASGLSHSDIVAEPERLIDEATQVRFQGLVARREIHEPVSRILGSREFYGRVFKVTPDVLDPRADTETLIAAALPLLEPGARILDLGTGSGAIIVSLVAERPEVTGVATDLSAKALAVAKANAEALGAGSRITFLMGSWFAPVIGTCDLIVSNPPYIAAGEIPGLAPDVRNFDPLPALDGGRDGLDAYREIAKGAKAHLKPSGRVLVEIGAGQENDVDGLFRKQGFRPAGVYRDLGGHIRCLGFITT